MQDDKRPGRVEDYTRPALIMIGVVLFMGLLTIKVVWGFLAALAVSYALARLIGPRRSSI